VNDYSIILVTDNKYDHLKQPQCSCGWTSGCFSKFYQHHIDRHLRDVNG
jgi:hypothetical protein